MGDTAFFWRGRSSGASSNLKFLLGRLESHSNPCWEAGGAGCLSGLNSHPAWTPQGNNIFQESKQKALWLLHVSGKPPEVAGDLKGEDLNCF